MGTHTSTTPRLTQLLALIVTMILATVGLLVTASPAHAAQVTTTVDGITYIADNADVSAGATITDYNPTIGGPIVSIPDAVAIGGTSYPVTTIGDSAFKDNQLTQVTLGDNVTTIGNYAFHTNQLTQVSLGGAVTTIDIAAFASNNLTEVTIGDAVTTIGDSAFKDNQLTQVTLGHAVTTIGTAAFASRDGLTEVTFTGAAPTSIVAAGSLSASLGTAAGLVVYYLPEYAAPDTPGGYTTPLWFGYTTQPIINGYTVIFDSAGGSTVTPVVVEHGDPITAPTNPTRDGYTFTGWYTDEDAIDAYDFDTVVTESFTLYAGWTQVTHTVSFDSAGGTMVTAATVNEGDPVLAPDEPARDGHTFTGWYSNEDATTLYDFDAPVTGDVTLYAGWEVNEYTITFDTVGGSTVAPVAVEHGDPATVPADPAREGYAFTGWYTDEDATAAYDFTSLVTGDVTLYAGWDKVAVEVPPAATPPGTAMLPTTGGVFDPWLPLTALLPYCLTAPRCRGQ